MRPPRTVPALQPLLLMILLVTAEAWGGSAVEQLPGAGDPAVAAAVATAAGAPGAATVPAAAGRGGHASPRAAARASVTTVDRQLASGRGLEQAQPQLAVATTLPPVFQHPLGSPEQHPSWQVAQQAHAEMQQWLQGFFSSSASRLTSTRLWQARQAPEAPRLVPAAEAKQMVGGSGLAPVSAPEDSCGAECSREAAEQVLLSLEQPGGSFLPLRWQPFLEDQRRWAAVDTAAAASAAAAAATAGSRGGSGSGPAASCLLRQPGEQIQRDYLVVAAVGNNLTGVSRWMDHSDSATFDLVLLHYGNATNISCPQCAALIHMAGPKWMLLHQLTQLPEWSQLSAGRKALMMADDDLLLDTCTINRAFEVFSAYGLLLGQPSLCPVEHRATWYTHLLQERASILRFVTMVEIMAPMFEMGFFQGFVRPSLHNAYTGWGLDFVWPFLLQYPRDRIGVIDDVCMLHPFGAQQKQGEGSVYQALRLVVPFDAREEEARRDAEYGYYPSEVWALGFPYRPIEMVGVVPKPGHIYPPPPLRGGIRALQPWLLYVQLTLVLMGVVMLVAWGRPRQLGSPRQSLLASAPASASSSPQQLQMHAVRKPLPV